MMNILSGFLDYSKPESVVNYQRIVESFKYGYGKRTELGDPKFVDGIQDVSKTIHFSYKAQSVRVKLS